MVLGLHAVCLPGLVGQCQSPELAVDLPRSPAGAPPMPPLLPQGLRGRVRHLVDDVVVSASPEALAPGVHREEWEVSYRGGFTRRVGRTLLVGPYQDPERLPCSVRLVVSQSLLDRARPLLAAEIARGLDGQFGFKRVADLGLVFAGDVSRVGGIQGDPGGAIVMSARLVFSRGDVPVAVVVRPRLGGGRLALVIDVDAKVRLSSTTADTLIHWLGVDKKINRLATDMAEREVDRALAPVAAFLATPPPVPLGDGRSLTLRYCTDVPVVITTGESLAVPLAVPLPETAAGIWPVALPPGPPAGAPAAPLALDLSLDALNAVLHQLWATAALDARLGHAALEARFNDLPEVRDLLTLRLGGPARLLLPPTVERSPDPARPFTLAVEAGVDLIDGTLVTPARLFGRMELDLSTDPAGRLAPNPVITTMAVSCEPRPGHLEPCYATIVDWARQGSAALHGPIAAELGHWFDGLVQGRAFAAPRGGGFTLGTVTLRPLVGPTSAWLRVEMEGALRP